MRRSSCSVTLLLALGLAAGVSAGGAAPRYGLVLLPREAGHRMRAAENGPQARAALWAGALAPGEEGGEPAGPHHLELFTWINFILLLAVLVYLLRKPIGGYFAGRSREVHEALDAARQALDDSAARLAEVEAKLQRLEKEIAAFQSAAAREAEEERRRLEESTEREAARLLESARAQMELATRAAKLELRTEAANQTVWLAAEMIHHRLDDPTRERLVRRFLSDLEDAGTARRAN